MRLKLLVSKLVHMLHELAAALAARLAGLEQSLRLFVGARFHRRVARHEFCAEFQLQTEHTVGNEMRHAVLELLCGLLVILPLEEGFLDALIAPLLRQLLVEGPVEPGALLELVAHRLLVHREQPFLVIGHGLCSQLPHVDLGGQGLHRCCTFMNELECECCFP